MLFHGQGSCFCQFKALAGASECRPSLCLSIFGELFGLFNQDNQHRMQVSRPNKLSIPNRNQFRSLSLPFESWNAKLSGFSGRDASNGFTVLFARIIICADNFAFCITNRLLSKRKDISAGLQQSLKFCLFLFGRASPVLLKRDGFPCKGLIYAINCSQSILIIGFLLDGSTLKLRYLVQKGLCN